MDAIDKDIAAAKKKGIKEKADLRQSSRQHWLKSRKSKTSLDTEIKNLQ